MSQVLDMLDYADDPAVEPFAEAAWDLFGPSARGGSSGAGGGGSNGENLGLLGNALMAQWRRDAGVPASS